MDPMQPFDSQMQLLSKVLDLRAKNAELISANIANAETPGYSPSHLEFEQDLAAALGKHGQLAMTTSHPSHLPVGPRNFQAITGKVVMERDKTGVGDDNGVSVDKELLNLSENELLYETAAQLLKKKTTLLKHVISGGQ
jgi:flagellar basal-body rod protein FlgB